MNTTIISTGEELVSGRTIDTNASFLASELGHCGFEVRRFLAVGDSPDQLQAELRKAAEDSRLVLITGGLGPTADDRTRQAVAAFAGRKLEEDEEAVRRIRDRLARYGVEMTDRHRSQARFPVGCQVFPNRRGTAAGFACRSDGAWIVCLPGVPDEMRAMFSDSVLPFLLQQLAPGGRMRRETVHLFPASESEIDERIKDLTTPGRNPSVGITVRDGVISVSLLARAEDEEETNRLLSNDLRALEERFGDLLFGYGDTTLAGALAERLQETGRTLGVAESCTGGLVGDMLVDVPGISEVFLADVVAYSNEAKIDLLGVDRELLAEHGAVSAEVAEAMARGACRAAGSELGISTTGIAGPSGGTSEKPVGLVYVGICLDAETEVRKLQLRGNRWRIKDRASKHALNSARLALSRGPNEPGR